MVHAGRGRREAGITVLVQGTGGVALFALQFAKAAGAAVIATSSSDEKLQRLEGTGRRRRHQLPQRLSNWPQAARAATGGRGVDIIVETGGATLPQSLVAAAFGGFVGVVGFVAGTKPHLVCVNCWDRCFAFKASPSVRGPASRR